MPENSGTNLKWKFLSFFCSLESQMVLFVGIFHLYVNGCPLIIVSQSLRNLGLLEVDYLVNFSKGLVGVFLLMFMVYFNVRFSFSFSFDIFLYFST